MAKIFIGGKKKAASLVSSALITTWVVTTCSCWRAAEGFQTTTTTTAFMWTTRRWSEKHPYHDLQIPLPSKRRRSSVSCRNAVNNKFPFLSIDPTDTWGNVAMLCGSATLAQILGTTTQVGKLLGPPVTAMALSFVVASVGIIHPGGTAMSQSLQWLSLSLATPLMLLGADLQDCARRCGPLLPSFLAASLATTMGCIVGWLCVGTKLVAALGPRDAVVIAAALLAKNIGGGINYIAVARCLSASPQAVAAGLVVDNLFALVYFPGTSALSAGRPDVVTTTDTDSATTGHDMETIKEDTTTENTTTAENGMTVFQICNLLFLSSTLLWLGERIGGPSGALPCCTLLALAFAFLAPKRWIASQVQKPAERLGTACLYLFFATAGAPGIAIADSVRTSLVPLSLYLSCLYGIHFAILWALYRIGKGLARTKSPNDSIPLSLVPQRLLVASSAAIGGPATAVALAQANHWPSLIVPSLLVGNIGYAIATFCGLGFARFFGGASSGGPGLLL